MMPLGQICVFYYYIVSPTFLAYLSPYQNQM